MTLDAALSLRPELRDRYTEYTELLAAATPSALAELGARRIAELHECGPSVRDEGLSPVERATITLAEKLAFRAHDVSDEDVAELARFLDERELVALACALALADLDCRLRIALEVA